MISDISSEKIETIIRDAAAKYIMPRFRQLKEHEIMAKTGPEDLVTAADIETEIALTEILQSEFPGSVVLGEEAVSKGEIDITKTFKSKPDLLWVIDPVDGTWNFANGSEIFGLMIALQYKGETVMSWIYNVPKDEFALAEKGQGATYAGEKITVAAQKPLDHLHGYASRYYAPKEIREAWKNKEQLLATVGGIRCAAHGYMRLARGITDFHIYIQTKPWDHLAGNLLVREAGGIVKRWDGETYDPIHYEKRGLLVTSTQQTWDDLHTLFLKDL